MTLSAPLCPSSIKVFTCARGCGPKKKRVAEKGSRAFFRQCLVGTWDGLKHHAYYHVQPFRQKLFSSVDDNVGVDSYRPKQMQHLYVYLSEHGICKAQFVLLKFSLCWCWKIMRKTLFVPVVGWLQLVAVYSILQWMQQRPQPAAATTVKCC